MESISFILIVAVYQKTTYWNVAPWVGMLVHKRKLLSWDDAIQISVSLKIFLLKQTHKTKIFKHKGLHLVLGSPVIHIKYK